MDEQLEIMQNLIDDASAMIATLDPKNDTIVAAQAELDAAQAALDAAKAAHAAGNDDLAASKMQESMTHLQNAINLMNQAMG